MTVTSQSSQLPDAVTRTIDILLPEIQPRVRQSKGTYVDVLSERGETDVRRGQKVFHSRAVALIYEKLWRPGAARLFFGPRLRAKKERRMLVDMLCLEQGDRVIDVGCGPGNYVRPMASAVESGLVVGIDVSEAMISRAAARGGATNLAYVLGDAGVLPFKESSVDAVCCVGALHLIEDPMAAIDEMRRVLAKGGRIAILATCGKDASARSHGGVTVFRKSELTAALAERGFIDIRQRVVRRGQFVAGRLPAS